MEKIKEYWKTQECVTLQAGNCQLLLDKFAAQYEIKLPPDFTDYLLTIDGMHLSEMDKNGFCFLPLQAIQLTRSYHIDTANFPDAESYFVFADYFQKSWWYAMRLTDERKTENTVLGIGWERPKYIASSFTEFIELYLVDQARLYGD